MPKETFLLIDADPASRDQLRSTLEGWGYRVAVFTEFQSALEWFAEHRPAFVLLDAGMPGAFQFTSDIRPLSTDIMIVVTAAESRIHAVMENLKHSAEAFLPKPVAPVALEIAVQRAGRTRHLLQEVRQTCNQARDAHTCDNVAREVASERFLVVRQMIEKMSSFIAQVASGVQGGIRYFNELPYFVSVHSADCTVLAANSIVLKYLGNRLYAKSWDIYAGKRGTREGCPVGRTVRSGNVETTRALVRYASGAKVPVLVHTAPIYDNEGEVVLVLEVFAGTQEIDQLAEQIRSTQQRYEQLFDAVPVQVVVLDRLSNITAVNSRFKSLFGDQVGNKFFDVFTPASFTTQQDPISMTLEDGQPHQGDMTLSGPDHTRYTMMTRTSPILTPTGKMMQVLAIMTDITEYRQMKDHMATLGLMLSTVCHDMKGCLTGLDAGIYQIDSGFYRNIPGRIEEGIETVRLMAGRISKLALDVLFSTKERPLELESIDVLKFAGDIAAGIGGRIRGSNITFTCDFSSCDGEIEIDAGLMRSAVTNILENAMEACLENDLDHPQVIAFVVFSKKDHIIMEIRDNGKGIAAEEIKQIFDLFHSSKGRRGTGLGLHITDKAVKKHNGHIQVDSRPGRGTTFRLCLPRRQSDKTPRVDQHLAAD